MSSTLITSYVILFGILLLVLIVYFILEKPKPSTSDKKNNRNVKFLLYLTIFFVGFGLFSPLIVFKSVQQEEVKGSKKNEEGDSKKEIYEISGSYGDTFGGLANPFIALAAVIVTGLAFYMQYQANEQAREQFYKGLEAQKEQFDEQIRQQNDHFERNSYSFERNKFEANIQSEFYSF